MKVHQPLIHAKSKRPDKLLDTYKDGWLRGVRHHVDMEVILESIPDLPCNPSVHEFRRRLCGVEQSASCRVKVKPRYAMSAQERSEIFLGPWDEGFPPRVLLSSSEEPCDINPRIKQCNSGEWEVIRQTEIDRTCHLFEVLGNRIVHHESQREFY